MSSADTKDEDSALSSSFSWEREFEDATSPDDFSGEPEKKAALFAAIVADEDIVLEREIS